MTVEYRCWICLEDSETLDGMIAPCACAGTNRWVHESCLKTYCLEHLASNAASSPSLRVACPICCTDYQITTRGGTLPLSGWRDMMAWTKTDSQLLLRHARFFFLIAPLVGSSLIAWSWLGMYWRDLHRNGPGEPLMEGAAADSTSPAPPGEALRALLLWLPGFLRRVFETQLSEEYFAASPPEGTHSSSPRIPASGADAGAPEPTAHPAGISKNWSMLYVWLQYAQWYKVLCWLLVLVLGGSEGLLPQAAREAFRVEELLLASETRAQVFIFGQCIPFILTKARHFLVTWAGSWRLIRFVFYSAFTSHVEIAVTLSCDSIVAVHLVYDWMWSATNDFSLRLNLNRLRSGDYAIASHPPGGHGDDLTDVGTAGSRTSGDERRRRRGRP